MKKLCPELVSLDDTALADFWKAHKPTDFKNLGDRLLAESLPRFAQRGPEFFLENATQQREEKHKSLDQMAQYLGINPTVLQAWESGEVRPPASLALIYRSL